MDTYWLAGIALTIIGGLVGAIYLGGQRRDDKQDERMAGNERALDNHARDDIAAHERLRAVETEVANLKTEVAGLRERWHDLRSEITHTISTWYADIIERIKK